MSCDKYARMIIKRGAGVPTVPATSSHNDGTWLATDIYEGEFYQDTDTGLTYTRNGSVISRSGTNGEYLRAVISVTQTSTNAPVVTEHLNEIGTLTSAYVGVGQFEINSSALFTFGKTQVISQYAHNGRKYAECNIKPLDPTNAISIISQDSSYTSANDMLVDYFIEIIIWL